MPKHLTDEACAFLITGTGFFAFKNRGGLIKELKQFIPENHFLVTIVKKPVYKSALEQLVALRNFAAHESASSRKAVLAAIQGQRIQSSGAWLKREGRLDNVINKLKDLATEIEFAAPF